MPTLTPKESKVIPKDTAYSPETTKIDLILVKYMNEYSNDMLVELANELRQIRQEAIKEERERFIKSLEDKE